MGRPAKPIEAKELAGNPGKRNLPDPVATIPGLATIPDPPANLDDAGKAFWADVWAAGHIWLSPELDGATVELAARIFDEIATYRRAMRGPLIKEPIVSPSGKVVGERFVANPAEAMLRRAEKQLQSWLMVLGIPPAARASLGLIRVKTESTLEQLLRGRQGRQDDVIDADSWGDDE